MSKLIKLITTQINSFLSIFIANNQHLEKINHFMPKSYFFYQFKHKLKNNL